MLLQNKLVENRLDYFPFNQITLQLNAISSEEVLLNNVV